MKNLKNHYYLLILFVIALVNISWISPTNNSNPFKKNHNLQIESTNVICGEIFYDSGGINNNYGDNENITTTICPSNSGEIVIASFNSFVIENGYDKLRIYDGDTATNLIGEYTGTNSPEIVYSTLENGGCLTFVFTSDNSINRSGWEASISCSTPPTCDIPSSFSPYSITTDSASFFINDDNQPQPSYWEVEYGLTGFTQGTGSVITTTSDFFNLSGLTDNTEYDFYVRSNCGNDGFSIWSLPTTFSTLIIPPTCGEVFYDTGGQDGNYSNNENITTTICPENEGEVVTVSFNLFSIENGYDVLKIYDGDSESNLIGEYTGTNSPGTITATLSNGGCLTFVFISDYTQTRLGWEATISCDIPPTCLTPINFNLDDVTENSATFSFNNYNQSQTSFWEIEYGVTGFTQGNGTLYTATSNPFTITGLVGGVTYDAYIRANCGNNDVSNWSASITFTPDLYIPSCGEVFYDTGGAQGNYFNNQNNTITICPEVSGEIVIVSFISFDLENNYDKLKIYDGTSNNLIGEYTGTNSPGIVSGSLANGGCLTFVFTSDFSQTRSGWEATISCQTPPTCSTPSEVIVDSVSIDSVSLFINDINQPQAPSWEIEYGPAGFTQGTGTIYTATSDFFTINGLSSGTTYEAYVRAICEEDDVSIWTTPVSFTTTLIPVSCGDIFYDTGGANSNYGNSENITTTICPINSGDVVTVTFNAFDIENNYDKLKIYDGDSTTNLIGEYTGTVSPGVISATTANGGCLTFVFTSDYVETHSGWEASVICGLPPTCYTPSEFIVDNVANNSVSIFINDVNSPSATTWEIEYGPIGFTHGTGTIYTATSDYFTINGLYSGTSYEAYVRAICSDTDSSFWSASVTFTTSGVAAVTDLKLAKFNIFPNPTKNTVTVQLNDFNTTFSIKITDIQGKKVLSKKGLTHQTTIDVSKLEKGIYFINIQTRKQRFIKKIIKN